MRKLISILICSLLLCSCSFIHKMSIEQGNVITSDMVKQLHPGMTEASVKEIMGTPVLMNTFNTDRIDYVYTYKPGGGKMKEKCITLIFNKKGVLQEVQGNRYSEFMDK